MSRSSEMIRRWLKSSALIRKFSNWPKDLSLLKVQFGSIKMADTYCSAIRTQTRFTSTCPQEIKTASSACFARQVDIRVRTSQSMVNPDQMDSPSIHKDA